MDVAAAGRIKPVKIRMSVQPQHKERTALRSGIARRPGNRAERQTVIPAREDREVPTFKTLKGCRLQSACPGYGVAEVFSGLIMVQVHNGPGRHVPTIRGLAPDVAQGFREPCCSISLRPHLATALSGTGAKRNTQNDAFSFQFRTLLSVLIVGWLPHR